MGIQKLLNPEFIFMKISFEKKIWFEATAKLIRLYKNLSEKDFQFRQGGEYRMMERVRTKIQLSKAEFYKMVGLNFNNDVCASDANILTSNTSVRR